MSSSSPITGKRKGRTFEELSEYVNDVVVPAFEETRKSLGSWTLPPPVQVVTKLRAKPMFVHAYGKQHRLTLGMKTPQILIEPSVNFSEDHEMDVAFTQEFATDTSVLKNAHEIVKKTRPDAYKIVAFPPFWQKNPPETTQEEIHVDVIVLVFQKFEWEYVEVGTYGGEHYGPVVFSVIEGEKTSVKSLLDVAFQPLGKSAVHVKHPFAHALLLEPDVFEDENEFVVGKAFDINAWCVNKL